MNGYVTKLGVKMGENMEPLPEAKITSSSDQSVDPISPESVVSKPPKQPS
jgi:hypothetical protein